MIFLARMLFLCAAIWTMGFAWFVDKIPGTVDDRESRTDVIVVLTGGSDRVREGLRLLHGGFGGRLFISGVGGQTTKQELFTENRVTAGAAAALDPYTILGHAADSTRGNAREVGRWMRDNGFRSLRLVTSNYHMLRSLLEFRRAMPGLHIVPHPVFPENVRAGEWWKRPATVALLATEYSKFLAVASRDMTLRAGAEIVYWVNRWL